MAKMAFSIREVAEALGVSISLVWHAVRDGQVRAFRFGGRVLIPATELQRVMNEGLAPGWTSTNPLRKRKPRKTAKSEGAA